METERSSPSQTPRKERHLMLKRPFKSLIARIAIIALVLSLVVPFVPAAFAQDTSINYPENGTDPVATFYATDEEDDAIEWSLDGDDKDKFTIVGGVLAFKDSPNFEDPKDQTENNVYDVTVKAGGGDNEVAVTVTNVDEPGTAKFDQPQPQVGQTVTASISDPDGNENPAWQWARSEDGETAWTNISGATSANRIPVAADVGMYLRATVVYDDAFAENKTEAVMSPNAVEERPSANARPSFDGQDQNPSH